MAPFPERRRGRPHPSRPRAPSRAAPSAAGPSEARLGRSRKQRVSSSPPSAHAPPPPGEHTGKSPPCRDARLPGGPGRPADGVPAGLPARRRLQREGVTSAPAREASELGCTWGLRTPRRGHREGRGHGTVHGAAPDLAASVSLLPEPTALTFSRVSFSSLSGGAGDKEQRGQGDGVLHFYFGEFGREPRRCRQHSRGRQTVLPAPFSHSALQRRPQGPRGIRMTSPLSAQT